MKIPQELVAVIFVGGVIVFFLFVIFSSRKNNSKDLITIKSLTVNDSLRERVKPWTG